MKSKAQKGPDVRKNWREKKRETTLRIVREQYISWPTESPPPATVVKSGTVAYKSPLLTYPMGHRLTLCLQKIPQRLFQSSKPVIAGCWVWGKYDVCVWVWGVWVLSELGGGCGNSAWGGMWGGMCFFLRSEPSLRPLFPPNPDMCKLRWRPPPIDSEAAAVGFLILDG